MNKKIVAVVIAGTSIIFISLFAYLFINKETNVVGKILSITGLVEVKKEAENKILKVFANMAFTEGDTLMTGADGRAELAIDENKEIQVAPNTQVSFIELVTSINAKAGKSYLYLKEGKVKIKIEEKLKGDSRFNIETPNAIMGVMGTEFFVYYDAKGTWVGVLEGEVEVVTDDGNRILLVPLNKSVFIGYDGEIEIVDLDMEQVRKFDAEIISNADEDRIIVDTTFLSALLNDKGEKEDAINQQTGDQAQLIDNTMQRTILNNRPLAQGRIRNQPNATMSQAIEETPPVEEEPPYEEIPPVEEEPSYEETPTVEEEPPYEEIPSVEEEPPYEEIPPVEEEPPYEEIPPVEEEPPYEEIPPVEEEEPPYEETPPVEEEEPPYEETPPVEEEEPPYEETPPVEEEDPPYEEEPPMDPPYKET